MSKYRVDLKLISSSLQDKALSFRTEIDSCETIMVHTYSPSHQIIILIVKIMIIPEVLGTFQRALWQSVAMTIWPHRSIRTACLYIPIGNGVAALGYPSDSITE